METIRTRAKWCALISLISFSFNCPSALAEIKPGRWKIGAGTVFLHFADGKYSDAEGREIPPAFQDDVDYQNFTFGLGEPQAGVDVGAAVFDNLLIGARLRLGYDTQTVEYGNQAETDNQSAFTLSFLPYAEYVFLDGLLRPFIVVVTGVDGRVGEMDDTGVSQWAFFAGAGGGAHIFLGESFSLDFSLIPGLGVGRGKNEIEDRQWKYDNLYFDLTLAIGVSGWI